MKLPLVATRIGIIAVKLSVVVIVILSITPFLTGDVTIDFDTDQETDWTYEGGVVRLSAPFTIDNQGFFDINDMHLDMTLRDHDGGLLVESSSDPMNAPAGRESDLHLNMEIDLNDLSREYLSDMIFNGTDMTIAVSFSVKYTMDLVQAGAGFETDMEWEAMLRDMQVETYGAYPYLSDGYYMQIPYSFQSSGMLDGQPVLVTVGFSDSHDYREEVSVLVYPMGYYNDFASVPITQEIYERLMVQGEQLTASLTLGFMDCTNTVEQSWWWSP